MTKKLAVIFLIEVLFLIGCSKSQTEEDFFNETSKKASESSSINKKFALNEFISGSWEGKCYGNDSDKVVVEFQTNARIKVTYYSPNLDSKSAYEQGLYEIVDENKIKFHYIMFGDIIDINKVSEDKFNLGGSDKSAINGCDFDRIER